MPDLKCKCSTPFGQGWTIVTCKQSSCIQCCPRTLIEEVTSVKPTSEIPNIVKNNISNNDYIYLTSSITGLQRKIPAPNFFPSINIVGKGSESIWISPLMQKNQINLKGLLSGNTSKLTLSSVNNNIVFDVQETGIDLDLCNNTTAQFLDSAYLGPTTSSITTLDVTGILGAAYGGTGLSTITKGSILYASALDTFASAELATNGQLLIGHSTNGYPIPGYITSLDASVTVNNYAGNIDLSVSTLAQLTADLDMGAKNINMNEVAGDSWLTGDGTNEGILVAATGRVLIGDNLPTKIAPIGQLHLGGDATKAIVIGNENNYKNHSISLQDAAASVNATNLSILGASASSGNTDGGDVSMASGAANGNGAAGDVLLLGAAAPGSGTGGSILMTAGNSTSGTTGVITLKGYHTDETLTAIGTFSVLAGFELAANMPMYTKGRIYNRDTTMSGGDVEYQGNPSVLADDTAVITAANILAGICTITPTGDRSKATSSSADLIAGIGLTADNDSVDFTIINLAAGGSALDLTITVGGTNVAVVGNMHVSAYEVTDLAIATGSAQFRVRRINATAVTIYRLS